MGLPSTPSERDSAGEQRWAELHALAVHNGRLTNAERDERRVLWRKLEPGVQFAPSTAEMGRRFGHLARQKGQG